MSQLQSASGQRRPQTVSDMIVASESDFQKVLPSSVQPSMFVRLAVGQLRKNPDLNRIASENPGSLLRALLDCARLGHLPGTNDFWLVPIGGREPSIEGWESYRGAMRRYMRSGQIVAIKGQVVYSGDKFSFDPNADDVPNHEIDWYSDRGEPVMAYAYAVLPGGVTSQVGIADPGYIDRVRAMSRGSSSSSSPWRKWPEAMYLKCAINRLDPFLDSSAEEKRAPATGGSTPVVVDAERIEEAPAIGVQEPTEQEQAEWEQSQQPEAPATESANAAGPGPDGYEDPTTDGTDEINEMIGGNQ